MISLKIKMAAFKNAGEDVFAEGREKLEKIFPKEKLEYVEKDPDVLFFLSGGSERSALAAIEEGGFYALLTWEEGNSNASALETKAAMRKLNADSILLDIRGEKTVQILEQLLLVKNALGELNGSCLGLIGEVSEWLVASDVKAETFRSRLGVDLKKIAWDSLGDFSDMTAPQSFKDFYTQGDLEEIGKAGQVYSLLKNCVEKHQLDALSVECFSLVTSRAVSGCLALAELNKEGIPAACEGDTASAAGMMIANVLTGIVPWIANVARIGYEETLLAHCTISPTLITDFDIPTHYETNVGTAIRGKFKGEQITVFRIDEDISKIFITLGTIVDRPNYASACRTQIEVKFPNSAVDCLKEHPLGNHHLVLPGDHREILELAGRVLKLEQVS
jgi:L-fucose isomerase-like protein